jgi:hypothetical protein
MTRKWIVGGVLTAGLIAGTTALALAGGGSLPIGSADDDPPLSGPALEGASAAALESTGGGTVVDSEAGDGGEAYEVEVSLEDGRQVEVGLDESFQVVGTESDDDSGPDDDGPDDDDEPGDD